MYIYIHIHLNIHTHLSVYSYISHPIPHRKQQNKRAFPCKSQGEEQSEFITDEREVVSRKKKPQRYFYKGLGGH